MNAATYNTAATQFVVQTTYTFENSRRELFVGTKAYGELSDARNLSEATFFNTEEAAAGAAAKYGERIRQAGVTASLRVMAVNLTPTSSGTDV